MMEARRGRVRRAILALGITLVFCCPTWARVIYVDDNAPAPGDGASWDTPYRFLQDALADASDSHGPFEILVAQGTYKPDQSLAQPSGTGQREASFTLPPDTTLMGGYAGTGSPNPDLRDVELYPTVLTGDLANGDIPVEDPWPPFGIYPTRIDNSFCIVAFDIADANATLDGIIVTRTSTYRLDGEPAPERSGGLYVGRHTRVIVRDCIFTGNLTPGIRCSGATELTVADCTFRDNIYRDGGGGGIHIRAVAGPTHVIGCVFERNLAGEGGGIYSSYYGSHLRVEDCAFRDNATRWGPTGCGMGPYLSEGGVGGAVHSNGPGELLRCEFLGNSAGAGGAASLQADWTISDCTFRDNRAYESGGALFLQGGSKEVSGCRFVRNACHWDGGAIANWGGHVDFTQCLFAGNTAVTGGVIYARDSRWCQLRAREWVHRGFRLALDNCTIVDNLSDEGPRIWCGASNSGDKLEESALILSNCILDNGGDEIRYLNKMQISVSHSNLSGGHDAIPDPWECVVWGPGNLDVDPFFARPGYWDPNDMPDFAFPNLRKGASPEDLSYNGFVEGDYHLMSQAERWDPASESWAQDDITSPCIDAGDPNDPIGNEPFPNGGIVNMGAYGGTAEASMSNLPDVR